MLKKANTDEIFQQAFAEHNNSKLSEAAEGYRKVLSVEPENANALHLLGLIEFDWNNIEAAMPLVEKSLELVPDELRWLLNYGKILARAGRTELSVANYEKALSIDPDCLEAKMALGGLCYELGEFTDALKLYYNILCDNPHDTAVGIKYADTMKAMGEEKEADRFLSWFEEKAEVGVEAEAEAKV